MSVADWIAAILSGAVVLLVIYLIVAAWVIIAAGMRGR